MLIANLKFMIIPKIFYVLIFSFEENLAKSQANFEELLPKDLIMKKNWLIIGIAGALAFSCQSKSTTNSAPSGTVAPCKGDDCPAPPEAPYQDKVPCREDECDEMEAGEEAGTHIIEISEPEEKSAAVEPAATEEKSAESASTNDGPLQSNKTSDESAKAPEIKVNEPTTMFENILNNPVSEDTVVINGSVNVGSVDF